MSAISNGICSTIFVPTQKTSASHGHERMCNEQTNVQEIMAMALPQRAKLIDEIHRLEGLMAYAEGHGEWERLEELRARLKAVIDQMPRIEEERRP